MCDKIVQSYRIFPEDLEQHLNKLITFFEKQSENCQK